MRLMSLAVGLVLAAVTGCSLATGSGARGAPVEDALPGQDWALRDGTVTAAEYRTAVDRFISCVRAAGYPVSAPVLSPIDGLSLLYDITPSGEPQKYNDAVQRCNLEHLSLVEPTYVEARTQVMDTKLRPAVAACLRAKGVRVSGTERNAADFAAVAKDKPTVVECITASRQRVFPNLPAVATVRI
jgi:hypothetical protein